MVQVKLKEKTITKTAPVITVSNSTKSDHQEQRSLLILLEMVTQKQSLSSFASILFALSIVFYCAGYLRVELELHEQNERINALENNGQTEQRPSFELSLLDLPKTRSLGKIVSQVLFTV